MAGRFAGIVVRVLVLSHLLLLASYTFPEHWVPEPFRVIGQWWVRPLFHQQWKLFAPDPPDCSCALEWQDGNAAWHAVDAGHYLERRIIHNHCLWLAEGDASAERQARPALLRMVQAEDAPETRFRIVRHCIADPTRPTVREERLIPLYGP
ncbi:MAG: hypothetical protein KIT10_06475 [Flavobacteriales bacterium]|nr:hypothetical protein [Flavobacteriales bacterium]